MTRVVQFMRDLVAKGMSWEDAALFAERFEEGLDMATTAAAISPALEKKRQRDRDRYWRNKGETGAESASETVSEIAGETGAESAAKDAPAPVHTRGEDNPSRLEVTGLVVVGGVDAREPDQQTDDWPKGDAAEHVKLLVAHVASPWLDPQKSPDLITTRARLAAWKRDGASWIHDVLPTIEGLMAGRRSKVSSWKFFDAAIGRAIADNRAALEIPEAQARAPPRQGITDKIADERRRATELTLAALKASNG